ncbi:thiosulfate sulfurtransferase/rhodanese-like domain-containing protein 3 [Colius striatus]|uniref:thiosulfate sulfurtransferase/rhodanese-like domain-containing protein 3 n=1 Tax=Colius striatus TaxID=57412 RepID=UPI002B1D641A|nr:thiosulfate sulfurtransferase/rhodanese-like domain-containing protein 3 [Colius striatus]
MKSLVFTPVRRCSPSLQRRLTASGPALRRGRCLRGSRLLPRRRGRGRGWEAVGEWRDGLGRAAAMFGGGLRGALRAASGGWRRAAAPGPGAAGAVSRSLSAGEAPSLSYQELKDLKKTNVLHIDVRERWEVDRSGRIPASINIPLGELVEALQMNPMEFKEQYNQKMPSKSDPVVFSCLAGTRSKQALGFARSLGFCRVQQYAGGFEDWVKHEPPEKK